MKICFIETSFFCSAPRTAGLPWGRPCPRSSLRSLLRREHSGMRRYIRTHPHASYWSEMGGSNSRPHAPKARALPAALHPDFGQSNMAMVFTSPVFRFLMMARMAVQETTSHLVGSSPSMVNHLFCATVGFFPCFIPIPPKRNRNLKSWWR